MQTVPNKSLMPKGTTLTCTRCRGQKTVKGAKGEILICPNCRGTGQAGGPVQTK